ncbi:MAG: S9 family peptidase [Candidatus Moduliflexus flocculans]|nr:S9 family peptidase [Candidatus Moduliflexus flocculans]
MRNLGVGDAWDVLSGIDYLVTKGLGRPRPGSACMGWSQGGYISAFLTTHDSARFKAVSVGRGHLELGDLLLQHRHHTRSRASYLRSTTRPTTPRSTPRPRR